jgi:arginyl-tRNA synthetase
LLYVLLFTDGRYIWPQPESFFNPLIPPTLEKLEKLGLIEDNDGARVIFVEGVDIPLIAVKRDGGYNYFSTDLASLWLDIFL